MFASHTYIDNKSAVAALFQQALTTAFPALSADDFKIEIEKPKNPDHGHYAVNSALQLAKKLGKKPREIAEALVAALPASDLLLQTPEIAGPVEESRSRTAPNHGIRFGRALECRF